MITIAEYQEKKLKKYYGSSRRVYRKCDLEEILTMRLNLNLLNERYERTRLVPYNEVFRIKKAIPIYNEYLAEMKSKYPDIKEFNDMKYIV